MKVKFVFNSILPKVLKVEAITLYPFIFFAHDEAYSLKHFIISHEMVHVEQVRRMGWFKMYWTYLVDYFKLRLKGKSHAESYAALSLEIEAYSRQYEKKLMYGYLEEKQNDKR